MSDQSKPEWLLNYVARPRGWVKGQSGNPAGRKPGVPNKRTVIAEEFERDGVAISRVVIEAAKKGDLQACSLVLSRLAPPLRPKAEKVTFELDAAAPLTAQAQQVLAAVAKGQLDPDTGKLLLDCINGLAGLRQVDEFAARLDRLEHAAARQNVAPVGGIVTDPSLLIGGPA